MQRNARPGDHGTSVSAAGGHHRPTVRAGLPLVLALTLVVTGCGGDDADPEPTAAATTAAATTEPSPVPSPSGSPPVAADDLDGLEFTIDESFWHSGYKVTLDSGSVEAERDTFDEVTGHTLTVAGTFENLGEDTFWFGPDLVIVQPDATYEGSNLGDVPEAAGGLSVAGELTFAVDEAFDPDQAVLVVGTADQAQAEVPLQPAAGDLVDLPPMEADVQGTMSVDPLDVEVVAAERRWDIPVDHDQAPAGEQALTLDLTVTSRKTGNWGLPDGSFVLVTPDGTSLPVDGSDMGGSLAGSEAGTDHEDLYLRFLVPEDASGQYALRMDPPEYWFADEPAEAELAFTLE